MKQLFKSSGFTLVEMIVVVAIVGVMLILGFPYLQAAMSDSKVPTAGADLQKIITVVSQNHVGGNAGYASASTTELATITVGMSAMFTPNSALTAVSHNLGASSGALTMGPTTISAANDGAVLTLSGAARGTCPGIVAALQHVALVMTINTTNVKAVGGAYNATAAQVACNDGDTNTYTFSFK
jgi:type IV pilus assembly protein PilA